MLGYYHSLITNIRIRKYKQCESCSKIEVDVEWLLPLEAIAQKKVKPEDIVNIPECPQCRDTITFNIITKAVPSISKA